MTDSVATKSSTLIVPARTDSLIFHMSVAEPSARPSWRPASMGPPVIMIAGRSTDAAPMIIAGVVLSHPESRTTPSIGLPRIDSSTSIAIRLRSSMAVGWICVSPSDVTGNSNGTPPASHTPRLTNSASAPRCWLHGVSSDAELQMPISGLPLKTSSGRPRLHPAAVDVVVAARALVPTRGTQPYRGFLLVGHDLIRSGGHTCASFVGAVRWDRVGEISDGSIRRRR